jgi:hypothetical protein
VVTVCEWFGLKTTRTVFADFASKPVATVSGGLTSKSAAMVSTGLASKLEDLKIQCFLRHEKNTKRY